MRRFVISAVLLVAGCSDGKSIELARSQVNTLADRLDSQVTAVGVYVHPGEGSEFDFKESLDPWGHPIKASYSRGGLQETLVVRSAGPDGLFANGDDILAERSKTNLAGVGSGLKENAA